MSRVPRSALIVAENISRRMSGETVLPYHYLAGLRQLGTHARAICHARCRDDLRADLPPELFALIDFVEDSPLQYAIYRIGQWFPYRVEDLVFNQLIHVITQFRMRGAVRRIIAEHGIEVVLEPAPIAPKALSFMYGLGVPVVIGPMSGGMELPPAFRRMDGRMVRWAITGARHGAGLLHRLIPGKLRAAALIVGNSRTRRAVPRGTTGEIREVMESGVEFERWAPKQHHPLPSGTPVSFVFCSRFVDWKGIKYLVEAFRPLAREGGARLELVGDGELYDDIAAQVAAAEMQDAVVLHGRLKFDDYIALLESADVYVTPSLRECGGMAMMEAMAIGLPVVSLRWGGGAQYASDACALFVDPVSEAAVVTGLTEAMRTLARSHDLRRTMGAAARQRIIDADLGWAAKVRDVAAIMAEMVDAARTPAVAEPVPQVAAIPAMRSSR
ncbi:glycosyltransferase family 4 protein [Sphingosinicellaceae bacterium]|nr:glycosyltransferase family 4 protein [Sphingosinicellaceae bacterium]